MPSGVKSKPIINRKQGFNQLFYISSCQWPTCLLLLHLLSSLPSIPGSPPASPSVLCEHTNVSLGFLTARLFLCLTCKLLHCLIVWFGLQSAKHVDTLIAHLGVSLCLSPCITAILLLPSLLSERLNHFGNGTRLVLSGPEPRPVFSLSIYFIFQLKCLQTQESIQKRNKCRRKISTLFLRASTRETTLKAAQISLFFPFTLNLSAYLSIASSAVLSCLYHFSTSGFLTLTLNNQTYIRRSKDARQRSQSVTSGKIQSSHVGCLRKREIRRAREKATECSCVEGEGHLYGSLLRG